MQLHCSFGGSRFWVAGGMYTPHTHKGRVSTAPFSHHKMGGLEGVSHNLLISHHKWAPVRAVSLVGMRSVWGSW